MSNVGAGLLPSKMFVVKINLPLHPQNLSFTCGLFTIVLFSTALSLLLSIPLSLGLAGVCWSILTPLSIPLSMELARVCLSISTALSLLLSIPLSSELAGLCLSTVLLLPFSTPLSSGMTVTVKELKSVSLVPDWLAKEL